MSGHFGSSFNHPRFDSGRLTTAIHREFLKQTVGLPGRETKASQRSPHGFRRNINERDGPTEGGL